VSKELCLSELTAETALQWARAAEVVYKESESMQSVMMEPEKFPIDGETNAVYYKATYYCCGKQGHIAADYWFRTTKCHLCLKVGRLARVCQSKQKSDAASKLWNSKNTRSSDVHQLHEDDSSSSNSAEGHLHIICQLENTCQKFIITVCINGMTLDMEIDSGAERSTIPWWIFHGKLTNARKLVETSVTLHQYNQLPLAVKGECHATVEVNGCVFEAVFIVVNVSTQYPLFGRDWMSRIGFDVTALLREATQVHCQVRV